MKHQQNLRMLVLAAVAIGVVSNPFTVLAAESNEFSLDQIIVTAMRVESKALETPAYVNTYTQEQLQDTGATNVLDRRDINTHGTTAYYALPCSYRLGYIQKF